MAGAHSEEYHRGEMDIHEQARTYRSFLILSKWGGLAIIVGVLFFALLFCTKTGFLGSAVTAAVVTTLAILLLRERKNVVH
jgi:hypothetical protein